MKVHDKWVWVTGAGSGIGQALCLALSKKGAHLLLSGRKKAALEHTQSLLYDNSQSAILPLDLADHEGLDQVLEKHHALLSKVDILVNNAGISQRSLSWETEFEVYKRLIEVNYLGTVKLSLYMLNHFRDKNEGMFVVISSSAGKFGVPMRSGYSGAKFALHGFFEAIRAELHKTNIKVCMVCPGFIKTDISKNALTGSGAAQGTMDKAQANGMDPSKLADIVLRAIDIEKPEVLIGGFKETKLAVWVSRIFPGVFRKIIANSDVT